MNPENNRKQAAFTRIRTLWVLLLLLTSTTLLLQASPPDWWTTRNVLTQDPAKDYAPLNQGQLKHLATAAYHEMEQTLPGGAGAPLHQLITSWNNPTETTRDYALVNQGQLKALAKPFYDRLILVGYTTLYPWTSTPDDDTNYTPANIGMAKHLFDFAPATAHLDTDADGLPDTWEILHGLDPAAPNNPDTDTDGDGLTDTEELYYTTNPTTSDTDSDGLPDGWEIVNGTRPFEPDADEDPDQDFLSNLDEYNLGTLANNPDTDGEGLIDGLEPGYSTNPLLADTDNDGFSDYEELFFILSDPTQDDGFGDYTEVFSVMGNAFTASTGTWIIENDSVVAQDMRGSLDYTVSIPDSGSYVLELNAHQHVAYTSEDEFTVRASVNGIHIGQNTFSAPQTGGSTLYFLPQLPAGDHHVHLEWLNGDTDTFLVVDSLRVLSLSGTDLDGNGLPDWLDFRIESLIDFDETAVTTHVSPYTLEGTAHHLNLLSVESSYQPEPEHTLLPQQALQGEFFAHIPLDPQGTTTVTVQGDSTGAYGSFTKEIIWEPLNIPAVADSGQLIRLDDSLLLAARHETSGSSDPVTLTVTPEGQGEPAATYTFTAEEAVIHTFGESGNFTVSADYLDPQGQPASASITVTVVSGDLGGTPTFISGNVRAWNLPGLSSEVLLQHDIPAIRFSEPEPGPDQGRTFHIVATSPGTILTRLGDENGPIIDAVSVNLLYDYKYNKGRASIIQTFTDGSVMIQSGINLGGDIPDDFSATIRLFASGLTFDDGTTTRTITAADLDELGRYHYYLIATSEVAKFCHSVQYFDGDARIDTSNVITIE